MRSEESSEKDTSSGHGIKQNSTECTWEEERMPINIWDLVFRLVLLYCHKFLFFLCKPYIARRGKNPTVLSQKGRGFNLSSSECYYVALPLLRSVSVKQI